MDKPGRHRTVLNPNFCILTGMSEPPCRDRIGVRGAHAPPEPTPLLVHDADRRRLLRYIQSDIVRHSNLRWCKPPDDNRPDRGTIDGSRPFRDYLRSTDVAWIGGVGALSPTRVSGHAMRTYSGRPSSSIRFSTSAAITTSIACRPSVWKRRPSPMTRFQREISDST